MVYPIAYGNAQVVLAELAEIASRLGGEPVLSLVTFANLKPGTGKTTSAVWLAHAFAEAGHGVLLADADPAQSALQWADLAGGFPFRVAELARPDLHASDRRLRPAG